MSKSPTTTRQQAQLKAFGLPTHRRPSTPGEILSEEFLKPLNISVSAFAEHIGITRTRASEIIHGRRGVSPDTAIRLSKAFGTTAQFWLNLQQNVDLFDAITGEGAQDLEHITALDLTAA